jgi:hypothetical protein
VPAAILAGCGGGGGGSDVDIGPAVAAPANAALYLDATVKPTGQAQADARAALSKVLNTADPAGKIVSLIEQQSKADGHPIDYQQDVAPWLGEKAGAFFTDLTDNAQKGAAVVETTDPAAALAFARKASGATATTPAPRSYNGGTYQQDPSQADTFFGTVGNFLVEGDETGVKAAIDAERGDSLGDSSDFKDVLDQLPSDRLGTFYTVPKTLLDSLGSGQIDQNTQAALQKTAGESLEKPVSGAVTASANHIELDATGAGNGVETPQSSLFGDVPSDSWLALGIANLGDVVKRSLDQLKSSIPNFDQVIQQVESTTGSSLDQLTGALGDSVVYVRGTTQRTLGGALVVQTKDPDLTGRLMRQLSGLLRFGGGSGVRPLRLSGGGTGFQINDPSLAQAPVEIAQQGDKLVIGYGAGSAQQSLSPTQKLADSSPFSTAQGQVSSLGTDFFLDFPKVLRLAKSQGAKSDPSFVQAKPYLDSLAYLVSGSGTKSDQTEVKAVLGLK